MNRRGFLAFLVSAPVTKALPWQKIANVLQPFAPAAARAISLSLSEIIALTMRKHRAEMIANITQKNALLASLTARGVVKPFRGGLPVIGAADDQLERYETTIRIRPPAERHAVKSS